MAFTTFQTTVAEVAQAAYGRALANSGMDHYAGLLESGALTEQDIMNEFMNNAEAELRYPPTQSEEEAVQQIFNNTLGRDAGAVGEAAYAELLRTGVLTEEELVTQILNDARSGGGDEEFLDARVAEAESAYEGETVITYNLTNGVDVASANIFTAGRVYDPEGDDQRNSLDDDDVLTGLGTDAVLNFSYVTDIDTGDYDITPTLNNVNTINLSASHSAAVVLDLQDATGTNVINVLRMDANVTLDNMTQAQTDLSVSHSNEIGNNLNFLYEDAALNATDNSVNLTMSNAEIATMTIEEIGAGNQGYETINLISNTSSNSITTALVAEDLATLNITGDQDMTIGALAEAGSLTTVDASALEAALDFTISAGVMGAVPDGASNGTVAFTLTSNASDDTVRISDQVGTNDVIAMGEGTADTLAMANTVSTIFLADNATAQVSGTELVTVTKTDDAAAANAVMDVDLDQMSGDQTVTLRNDDLTGADSTTFNLLNATAAEATGITLQHSGNDSTLAHDNGITENIVDVDVATGVTTAAIAITNGQNSEARFNFVFTADSDTTINPTTNATVTAHANTTNTVANVTIHDTDNESNTIALTQAAAHTGTVTIDGGVAGTFMNLDVDTAGGNSGIYGYDVTGTTTDSATITDVAATATNIRLVATTVDASTALSDVVVRVSDAPTAISAVGAQTITMGLGNDTVIFDDTGDARAGLTVSDTVAGGAGADTLAIDGTIQISLGASEWTNVSSFETLQLVGTVVAGGASNAINTANDYNLILTDQLIDDNATDGNLLTIVNDNGAVTGMSVNSGVTIDARTLVATNSFSYDGQEDSTNAAAISLLGVAQTAGTITSVMTADRFIFVDANINGSAVIDGGADLDGTNGTGLAGGTDNSHDSNLDIIEISNTAIVSAGDLANIVNVSNITFTNDENTDQTLTMELNDSIVDALVNNTAAADDTTAATIAQTFETLVITAVDNAALSDSILNIDASTMTNAALDLQIDGGNGDDTIALGASTSTYIVNDGTASTTHTGGTDTITGFTSTVDSLDLDISDYTLTGAAGDDLGNGFYYEGASGALTAGTAYDVIVLTGASYATIAAAETAVAATSTSATNGFVVFHNSATSQVEVYLDANLGADSAAMTAADVALVFSDLDDAGNTGTIGAMFAQTDFNLIA